MPSKTGRMCQGAVRRQRPNHSPLTRWSESHPFRLVSGQNLSSPGRRLCGNQLAEIADTATSRRSIVAARTGEGEGRTVGLGSPLRQQLLEILHAKALRSLGNPVRLSSGALSSHFIDGKKGLAAWRDLHVASQAIVETVTDAGFSFDAVGGLTMGADALSVGVAAVSDTSWFAIRKKPKEHGTKRRIEGARLEPGVKILLVDDVVTTGGSILKALGVVQGTGADIVAAVTLVDRGDLARAKLRERGIAYFPMATYEDLGIEPVTFGVVASATG